MNGLANRRYGIPTKRSLVGAQRWSEVFALKFFKPSDRLISSAAKGLQKVVIGGLHGIASLRAGLLFDGLKGGKFGNFIGQQKAAKLAEAVVVKLPLKALLRLVAFVRP